MSECVITMKSQTNAEAARRTASGMRIAARVVSVDPHVTKHGCSFGLKTSCAELDRLKRALDQKGIAYGEVIGRGGFT
ncbi:MAG: DUF3343 domain-containing protein [Clostridia bacterium]|nr:DUF3343 domain-containing protein [Clostridia bacterium]